MILPLLFQAQKVAEELLDAPKLKKEKKEKKKSPQFGEDLDRVTWDQVRPGLTSQQHGPKLLYGFDARFPNHSISLDLCSPHTPFFLRPACTQFFCGPRVAERVIMRPHRPWSGPSTVKIFTPWKANPNSNPNPNVSPNFWKSPLFPHVGAQLCPETLASSLSQIWTSSSPSKMKFSTYWKANFWKSPLLHTLGPQVCPQTLFFYHSPNFGHHLVHQSEGSSFTRITPWKANPNPNPNPNA